MNCSILRIRVFSNDFAMPIAEIQEVPCLQQQ